MLEMICGATGKPCPYATLNDGTKPCSSCEIGIEFLKDFIPIDLDAE